MSRIKIGILALSLVLGVTGTLAFAPYLPKPEPLKSQQQAWWGGLYPEYCLPGAMRLTGAGEEEADEELPVKISFKYLTFLNEPGDSI